MSLVLATNVDDLTAQAVARAATSMQARPERITAEEGLRRLEEMTDGVDLVLVGTGVDEPVRMAQRVYVLAPRVPVLILAWPERLDAVRGAIQFAPYVSEDLRCLPATDLDVVELTVKETLERVRSARAYRRTLTALNERLGEAPPTSKPAILGGILDNAPIGVVVLGEGSSIRAWNRKSTELLGQAERDVLGDAFDDLLPEAVRPRWQQLLSSLKDPRLEAATSVFERPRDGQPQHLEVIAARLRTRPETHLLLLQDVSERVTLVRDLHQAIQARDEFLGIAAHELRTPLTSVALTVQNLKRHLDDPDHPQLPARVAAIDRGVVRLARLVEVLLDVTRITAGRLNVQREPVDLTALTGALLERLRVDAEAVGCTLSLSHEGPLPGRWDLVRIEQVLTNLVVNALKFGPGEPIDLVLSSTPHTATITVSDHGIGMDASQQDRVFQRFERAVSDRHYGGLGLGLWITRTLVEAHGGTIRVENRPGGGSTFVVELPRA